jgi:hypothetical protein
MTKLRENQILPVVLIVALLFFLLEPGQVAFNAAIIAGVIVLPQFRFPILLSAAVIYWYNLGPFEAGHLEETILANGWQFRLAALITALTIVMTLVRIRSHLKFPVLTSFVLLIGIFLLGSFPYSNPNLTLLFFALTIYFKFFFWYLVYLLIETETSFKANALFTLPFWSHISGYLPSATGPAALMLQQAEDEHGLRECHWAAVKILLSAVAIRYGAVLLNNLVFANSWDWLPSLEITPMTDDFLMIRSAQAQLPLWEKWLALITHVLLRYMQFAGNFAIIVGQARAVGFMIPSMTNSPWAATSFGDLFSRLLYHYNRLLMRVFYPRIKETLRFVPNARLRVIISLFLSISLGGILFHYPRDSRSDYFKYGFLQSLAEYTNAFPYFFVLAAFVCVTVHFRNKRFQPPLAWRIIRPGVYFVMFSLIYTLYMAGVHNRGSWFAYYNYLLNLLNLA